MIADVSKKLFPCCASKVSELTLRAVLYNSQGGELIWSILDQVYLARLPGSPSGLVAWQMDFTDCDLVIDTITIATHSVSTESGRVEWKLEGDDEIVKNLALRDGM